MTLLSFSRLSVVTLALSPLATACVHFRATYSGNSLWENIKSCDTDLYIDGLFTGNLVDNGALRCMRQPLQYGPLLDGGPTIPFTCNSGYSAYFDINNDMMYYQYAGFSGSFKTSDHEDQIFADVWGC